MNINIFLNSVTIGTHLVFLSVIQLSAINIQKYSYLQRAFYFFVALFSF